jgi:hypothetical protein
MMDIEEDLRWAFHNTVGHTLQTLIFWIGGRTEEARSLGDMVHDMTLPSSEKTKPKAYLDYRDGVEVSGRYHNMEFTLSGLPEGFTGKVILESE